MLVNIEAERARLQLTKSEISKRLGITGATYNNYLNGIRPIPSAILLKMADMFGCSTDYLLGLNNLRNLGRGQNIEQS